MTWRKWLVRGLVFSVLGLLLLAASVYQALTNPGAVRRLVLAKLGERFIGAVCGVESAHLRLLGGIFVRDLRMARRDELDRTDFLYAPSLLIYHDKEQLVEGNLAIRQVVLDRPRLRIIRQRDGRINLEGILGPINLRERVPMIVLRQATVVIEDRQADNGPVVELRDVQLTAINDPLPTLVIEGTGQSDVAGPVQFKVSLQRATNHAVATIEFASLPIGPALIARVAGLFPAAANHVRQLTGLGRITATIVHDPAAQPALSYDLTAELQRGELVHPRLPLPLEHLEVSARIVDGRAPLVRCKARSGAATLIATLKNLTPPKDNPLDYENYIEELDFRVEHLPVTPSLFTHLTAELQEIEHDYHPAGPATLEHTLRREPDGSWRKHWTIRPEGMTGIFFKFPYPLEQVTGTIERESQPDRRHVIMVNLSGKAGGRPVRAMGRIDGYKSREAVEVDIWGDDIPLDERVRQALSPKLRDLADQFHPTGRADFKAYIRREADHKEFANRYSIRFRDATVRYRLFPYPLEQVTGRLDVFPDHWECRDFRGTHKGGEFLVSGGSTPLATRESLGGDPAHRIAVTIQGKNILLDPEFEAALAPPEAPNRVPLQRAWRTLALAGRLSFTAEVVDLPGQPQEIDVGVTIRGCTMQPKFFPYALDDVGGTVRYTRDRVWIRDVMARHGPCRLGFRDGQVILKPSGGFQARLGGITGEPIVLDAELLRALPPVLRKGIEPLKLSDPINVRTDLVVDINGEGGLPPVIWWDGTASLANATLRTGIELTGVSGRIASRGRHNGAQLEGLTGNLLISRANVLKQPMTNLQGQLEIRGDSPDVLRIRNLQAEVHGGTFGGEARVEFGHGLRYEVALKALGVQLEQFARHNLASDASIQGPAEASLHLTGDASGVAGLRGNGRIDVANGRLYRLPVILDLFKTVGLRMPDRTAFEQAAVQFHVDGPQLQIQQLDLYGNVVSLRGQGTVNLDGTDLNLDVYADPARFLQILPTGLDELPRAVTDRLFKIRMTGEVGKVRYERELVPVVTEPIKRALRER